MNINEPAMVPADQSEGSEPEENEPALDNGEENVQQVLVQPNAVKMFRCKTENRSDRKEEANPKNAHLFKRFECSGLMVFRELWMQEKMRLF